MWRGTRPSTNFKRESMANKLLNLDDFVPDVKVIKLQGVDHEMVELTVEQYLGKLREAQKVKDEDLTVDQQIDRTIEMIREAFPTIPVEALKALSLTKLTILLDFMLKTPEAIEAETRAAAGNAAGA